MVRGREQEIDHILRRTGFGATQEEVDTYANLAFAGPTLALSRIINYADIPDDVDANIGKPGYVGITARGAFQPTQNITDARQRWLFRMVHSRRPLQEKMALFWHNHFATALHEGGRRTRRRERGTRMLAAKPSEDPGGVPRVSSSCSASTRSGISGICCRRGEGSRDAGLARRPSERAQSAAGELRPRADGAVHHGRRHVRGDGRLCRRARLHWLEPVPDRRPARRASSSATTPPTTRPPRRRSRSPIYPDGGKTIPARSADSGMQDGIDLINAVARHPATGPRLAAQAVRVLHQRG